MYSDISQLCTCRRLISRTCHHNVSHSGSLDLIWGNILDYFQEKWEKKNYRPKHKYCGAQTAVPPVLTAALGLIETHPGEQQRRKTAHTLLFAAEESLLKNRKQEEIQVKFYAARNTICSLNP